MKDFNYRKRIENNMIESLTPNGNTFEEIIEFGLSKFRENNKENEYIVAVIRSNKSFFSMTKFALQDLLSSTIKHKPIVNSFMEWLESVCPIYLKDSEPFYGRKNESKDKLEERIVECEKRIEGLYDILEDLIKKIQD